MAVRIPDSPLMLYSLYFPFLFSTKGSEFCLSTCLVTISLSCCSRVTVTLCVLHVCPSVFRAWLSTAQCLYRRTVLFVFIYSTTVTSVIKRSCSSCRPASISSRPQLPPLPPATTATTSLVIPAPPMIMAPVSPCTPTFVSRTWAPSVGPARRSSRRPTYQRLMDHCCYCHWCGHPRWKPGASGCSSSAWSVAAPSSGCVSIR